MKVYLTGDLCFELNGNLVASAAFPGRQGRVAFAYLVVERERVVTRDELIGLLWPEQAPRSYEVALSALMSKLRQLLGRRSLETAARGYRLDLPADAWVDIESAVASVHEAEAALRNGDHRAAYGPAVVAGAILRRRFLHGEDGEWIEDRRQKLLRFRLRALDCLAAIHAWNREPALAVRAAEEAIELEPYREASYRMLMRVHEGAGNPSAARQVYHRLAQLLEADLGARPAPETEAVFKELGRGRSTLSI